MVEYKVIKLGSREMEKTFNELAKEGWRVVSTTVNSETGRVICTLERAANEE